MADLQPPSTGLARFRAKLTERTTESSRSPEAQAIHERVDQLVELEIRDVMTPRTDVAYLVTPVTPEAVAEAVRDTGHSGFPVVNDDLDDVIEDAIVSNAKTVWMQLNVVNESAARKAEAAGLRVVMDRCIAVEHRRLRAE